MEPPKAPICATVQTANPKPLGHPVNGGAQVNAYSRRDLNPILHQRHVLIPARNVSSTVADGRDG